jgi:polysaccharide export outer membrane protein
MKHATVIVHAGVVALATLCTLAPQRAGAQPLEGDTKPVPTAPAIAASYRIGPGDKLRIEVYKDPQLSQSLQVRPDGKITLPLLGDLDATGQTPIALRDSIAGKLKEFMTNPVVTVIVVEASPATAYVVGEVNRPGAITMPTGPVTVLQALAMAGGLKDFADSKNIRILRSSTVFGTQAISFNYRDAIRGGTALYLHAGDTVVVPD